MKSMGPLKEVELSAVDDDTPTGIFIESEPPQNPQNNTIKPVGAV